MRSAVLHPVVLLAGCTVAPDNSPSLLPRPIEARSDAEPVRLAPVATPDAALDAEIARRRAGFDAAARTFEAEARSADARIVRGAGAAQGSERWIDAQAAIGELGQALSGLDAALAELEELAIARATARQPPYPLLDRHILQAQATLDRHRATLAALTARAGAP